MDGTDSGVARRYAGLRDTAPRVSLLRVPPDTRTRPRTAWPDTCGAGWVGSRPRPLRRVGAYTRPGCSGGSSRPARRRSPDDVGRCVHAQTQLTRGPQAGYIS